MILILRPYHILCRLGYFGYGYSPEYMDEMARITRLFNSGRVKTIIVKPGFDNICRSCPHHEEECSSEKNGYRGRVASELDRRTLRALKLKPGHPYPLPEIDERIASLTENDFLEICKECEWQILGHCQKALKELQKRLALA